MDIVLMLIVGLLAGWIASTLMRGRGLGILGDIVVGIIGAVIGGYLLGALGIYTGDSLLATLVAAVIGSVILLALISLIRGRGMYGENRM